MSPSAARRPSLRLPNWVWAILFVFFAPFLYFFLRETPHSVAISTSENIFLIIYAPLLSLNYCIAFKNRDAIFDALPAWLVPQWRRLVLFVAAICLLAAAITSLHLPAFYENVLERSLVFLLIPYLLVARPGFGSGRILETTLNPKASVNPALLDSTRELTISYNRRKANFLILGGAAFVAAGIFMRHDYPAVAWSSICFFGLGIVIGFLNLIPGCAGLVVNNEGFVMINLWRRSRLRWNQVSDFEVVTMHGGTRCVGFNFTREASPDSPHWQKRLAARKWVRDMLGKDAALPATYNITPEDLCRIMTQRQARVLSTSA